MKRFLSVLAVYFLFISAAQAENAQAWYLVQDFSQISYNNPAVAGGVVPITAFDAQISFDPDRLSSSKIMIALDVSTLFLNAQDVNVQELSKLQPVTDLIAESPATAVFISSDISKAGGNIFNVEGQLTANKVTRPITIPMTASISKHPTGSPMLTLSGEFTVNRSQFTTQAMGATGPALIPFQIRISGVPY